MQQLKNTFKKQVIEAGHNVGDWTEHPVFGKSFIHLECQDCHGAVVIDPQNGKFVFPIRMKEQCPGPLIVPDLTKDPEND